MLRLLIVNPLTSGKFLSDSFKNLNIKTTALYTHNLEDIDKYFQPNPDDFNQQLFIPSHNTDTIVKALKNKSFDYVLNGCESSTHLTDCLANRLSPKYANDPQTAIYRSNKYWLHKQLEQNGLNHIKQTIFDLQKQNIKDLAYIDIDYPCFVKPLNGVGSCGIQKILTKQQLYEYFNKNQADIVQKLRLHSNEEESSQFLICEYIDGEEFFVDSYSHQGIHYISSVQKYTKKIINGIPIYRTVEVIKEDSLHREEIVNYIKKCLNAIGLNFGFAHSELFMSNNKPILIESNSRISGLKGYLNKLAKLNNFEMQTTLMANALTNKTHSIINPESSSSIILFIFNLSTTPLPDLRQKLSKYSTISHVDQLKPVGFTHPAKPITLMDLVAIVICSSNNKIELQQQVNEILTQDEKGW